MARQIVEGFLIGLHKSPFHGFSVEFAEHRQYHHGDNLRHVDWKAYGRTDRMFVKKFEEETNLRCCLALDTSASMSFRDGGLSKLEYSAILAASISHLLKKQMDACSLALFDESLYSLTPAKTGPTHMKFIVNELERALAETEKKKTNLTASLHQLADRLHKRSLVVIFSDAPQNPESAGELISAFQHLKYNKHEILFFHILNDAKELAFEFDNRPYTFEDMETGETVQLNPVQYRDAYLEKTRHYRETIRSACLKQKIDYVFCKTTDAPGEALVEYLTKRNKMM